MTTASTSVHDLAHQLLTDFFVDVDAFLSEIEK